MFLILELHNEHAQQKTQQYQEWKDTDYIRLCYFSVQLARHTRGLHELEDLWLVSAHWDIFLPPTSDIHPQPYSTWSCLAAAGL